MRLNIKGYECELTMAHSASSYGRPVVLIEGRAYGPSDLLPEEPAPAWLEELVADLRLAGLPAGERRIGPLLAAMWRDAHAFPGDAPNTFGCETPVTGGDCIDGYVFGSWRHSADCRLMARFCGVGGGDIDGND